MHRHPSTRPNRTSRNYIEMYDMNVFNLDCKFSRFDADFCWRGGSGQYFILHDHFRVLYFGAESLDKNTEEEPKVSTLSGNGQ